MRIKSSYSLALLVMLSLGFFSCKKDNTVSTPSLAEFVSPTKVGKYFIKNDPNSVFKIPVGITTVSNSPRTITFEVSSPSGAAEGQQYTLGTTTVTIPAGTAVDSIALKGIFAGYSGGRVDTLEFKITGGDVSTFKSADTYTVILQQYCDVDLSSFVGTYSNCFDDGSYGPYEIEVLSATSTGPTTGYLMIENLWDAGGSTPIRVNLDWTDPSNFTTYIPGGQSLYVDPGYGLARVDPDGTGPFSSCANTFTLSYEVYVDAGSFGTTITTMAR